MKHLLLLLIAIYQNFLVYILKSIVGTEHVCRFTTTCAEFARISIEEKGVLIGTKLALQRLIKCQPFYKGAYE
jgi:uncharacterized protein